MTWQIAILAQIIASSVMTMYTRRLSLSLKQVFFGLAVMSYIGVAAAGWLYAALFSDHLTPPTTATLPYLIAQGILIPASWLMQYKIISHVGASNAAIVATLNTLSAAAAGVLLLGDNLSLKFIIGSTLMVVSTLIALRLAPDAVHKSNISLATKATLAIASALLYGIGMYAEKIVVDDIGAWSYMGYGWSMQAIGAVALFILLGRSEIKKVNKSLLSKGLILGLLTSIAGALYIYALSIGALSSTIVATSGKVVVVMILAALFMREYNALTTRITAFLLTTVGLVLVIW